MLSGRQFFFVFLAGLNFLVGLLLATSCKSGCFGEWFSGLEIDLITCFLCQITQLRLQIPMLLDTLWLRRRRGDLNSNSLFVFALYLCGFRSLISNSFLLLFCFDIKQLTLYFKYRTSDARIAPALESQKKVLLLLFKV